MSGERNSVGIADHNCLNFVTEIIKDPLTQEVVLYLWLQVFLLYVTGMGQSRELISGVCPAPA